MTKAEEFKIIVSYIEVEAGWAPRNPSQTKPKQSKTSGGRGVRAVQAQGTAPDSKHLCGKSAVRKHLHSSAGNGVGSSLTNLDER